MATFKFVGLKKRPGLVKTMGVVREIRLHNKDGSVSKLSPPNGDHWQVGDALETTDQRAVRHLEQDPRFRKVE